VTDSVTDSVTGYWWTYKIILKIMTFYEYPF
jgi:hypothetical protein